jgi:hypothetical protein
MAKTQAAKNTAGSKSRSNYAAYSKNARNHEWTRMQRMMLFMTIFAALLMLIKLIVIR